LGRVIETQQLFAHPDAPALDVHISCDVRLRDDALLLDFRVTGAIGRLRIPQATMPQRVDGLWQHCCFEAFLRPVTGTQYAEFNFAPSGTWAAYLFDSYRSGMADLALANIACASSVAHRDGQGHLNVAVALPLTDCPSLPCHLALSAVLEQDDGTLSYWALKHPAGPPDFHHPDCFTLRLEAPNAA
jgi:hypothetical protein